MFFLQGIVAVVSYSADVGTTYAWLDKLKRFAERARPKSLSSQLSLVAVCCLDSLNSRQSHVCAEPSMREREHVYFPISLLMHSQAGEKRSRPSLLALRFPVY
jgi:hypothetical protein